GAAIQDEERSALADALLRRARSADATYPDRGLRQHYTKLAHSGLAQQLETCLEESTTIARHVAIDVAEACKVESLLPQLVRIALDPADDSNIRRDAAYAVLHFGDSAAKARLKPLALGATGEDASDELKGIGL